MLRRLAASYAPLVIALATFRPLVADPSRTLMLTLPLTVMASLLSPSARRGRLGPVQTVSYLSAIAIPSTYALVVLMGAPLTTHIPETILFSAHVATMAFCVALRELSIDKAAWLQLLPRQDDQNGPTESKKPRTTSNVRALCLVWGTLLGAYLGAIPIPLDWDRDWQRWPVTVHLGACIGHALGGSIYAILTIISKDSGSKDSGSGLKNDKIKREAAKLN